MTPIRFSTALVLGALGLAAVPAAAATVSYDVYAMANSSTGGTGLATGISLSTGDVFSVSAALDDTWSLGATTLRTGNADGLPAFSNWTQAGLSTLYGTLVGKIGSGAYFVIGTSFSGAANADGELFLYNWDSNASDNSGYITAEVTYGDVPVVPLPAAGLMLLSAVGALALRRKA